MKSGWDEAVEQIKADEDTFTIFELGTGHHVVDWKLESENPRIFHGTCMKCSEKVRAGVGVDELDLAEECAERAVDMTHWL